MVGNHNMSEESRINESCDFLIRNTDNELFSENFRIILFQITDAARKYVKLREALKD